MQNSRLISEFPERVRYVVTSAPESWELAFDDIRTVDVSARIVSSLSTGVFVVESACRPTLLAARLRESGVFVRHLFPVAEIIQRFHDDADLTLLVDACVGLRERLNPAGAFSVQTRVLTDAGPRNFDANRAVSEALADLGYALDVKRPAQVISIVCTESTTYLGVSAVGDNLSDWAGGVRRFAREPGQLSRAEFKILEAIEVFGVELPKIGLALDLGAAPGGWTRILRERGLRVVAVDPASLDPHIGSDAGVTHVRATAQKYLARHPGQAQFDLIVNDMRIDAAASARLMCDVAKLLKRDQLAIMTLKLRTQHQRKQVRNTLTVLAKMYRVRGCRKLFHNRTEVSVCLQKS